MCSGATRLSSYESNGALQKAIVETFYSDMAVRGKEGFVSDSSQCDIYRLQSHQPPLPPPPTGALGTNAEGLVIIVVPPTRSSVLRRQ
ncbi:hypothetical protein LguiA_029435 [Lonicera macranthoides]